jgi:hypothetical protein
MGKPEQVDDLTRIFLGFCIGLNRLERNVSKVCMSEMATV